VQHKPSLIARISSTLHSRRGDIGLFLIVWIVYAVHVVPGGGANPNRYLDLIYSGIDEGTLAIDDYHENTVDKAFKDGHYYTAGLPGPSLAGVPAYLAFKAVYPLIPGSLLNSISSIKSFQEGVNTGFYQKDNQAFFLSSIWLTVFVLSVISALAVVLFFHLLLNLGVTRTYALIAAAIYAWGTLIFFYSTTFYSHVFAAALAVAALFCLSRMDTVPSLKWSVGSGFLTGLAILMEYQGFIIAACVGLFVLYRWGIRRFIGYGTGAAVPLGVLMAYNWRAFGGPLNLAQQYLAGPNKERFFAGGILGFVLPTPDRLLGLTILPERGLFVYCPILLLMFVGWSVMLRSQSPKLPGIARLSILASIGLFLFNASAGDWQAGASYGPRYLTSAVPFMMIGVAFALPVVSRWVWIPLAAVSLLNNWLGAQVGFAADVFDLWRKFLNQGFVLPSVSAVISHSRGTNPLLSFIIQWGWMIDLGYLLLILLLVRVLMGAVTDPSSARIEAASS
jgi:hypothetical protein